MADFYEQAASQRMAEIEAQKAQALADLQSARANQDTYSAAQSVQQIANLNAEANNLAALHNQYVQSQQPPQSPPLSKEQRHAKTWQEMDYSDVLEMAKGSKYAGDLDVDDPNFQAGLRDVYSRRQRGG